MKLTIFRRSLFSTLFMMALGTSVVAQEPDPVWLDQIKELVRLETWRNPGAADEAKQEVQVRKNIATIEDKIAGWISAFLEKEGIKNHIPKPFSWTSSGGDDDGKYRVFGWRVGKGTRKISLLTHMDTVPPGDPKDWKHDPFEPEIEIRDYKGTPTRFLTGRGTIDDKGPAIVTMYAFLEAIKQLDGTPKALDNVSFELIFDTSEETDFSTTKYFDENPGELTAQDLGIVYDAFWCIRAEKGIERPVFRFLNRASPTTGLWIKDFQSAPGPANQIPGGATAVITGIDQKQVQAFKNTVAQTYTDFTFDDPAYRKATMTVQEDSAGNIVLTTKVAGAQHGSAPQENREKGANPLVSLGFYLSHLSETHVLGQNQFSDAADFIRFGWGTMVFGETHTDLLYRYDSIFEKGNGTTYALSQLRAETQGELAGKAVSLAMDIRYAVGHHAKGWDGSEGLIDGKSVFQSVFAKLTERFKTQNTAAVVSFETATLAGPDIRDPDNQYISAVNNAYRDALQNSCPMQAIGGGTDAKGRLQLVAAGALFTDSLGPPINFHGINEGAPIPDLVKGKEILKALLIDAATQNK
jgi:succinyl-diaminopimelate desuccinylase